MFRPWLTMFGSRFSANFHPSEYSGRVVDGGGGESSRRIFPRGNWTFVTFFVCMLGPKIGITCRR